MDVHDDEVINAYGHPKNQHIVKLLKNERNNRIINTKGAYYYLNAQGKYVILSGLLPRLRKTFFPETNIFNLLKKPKITGVKKRGKKPKTAVKPKRAKEGKGWHYGKIRGTVVHQELEDFVLLDRKNFLKKHGSLHHLTHKILTFIIDTMKWQPLRSEFNIFDEGLGIGTSVDFIGTNEKGELVLVELKCGFTGYFDRSQGPMLRSLHKLSDSPHHQANLQIITAALLIMRHHGIPLDAMRLYVLRVDEHQVEPFEINNDYVKKMGVKIYRDLVATSR